MLGEDAFDIVDHWEDDLCAIGIAKPSNHEVLVYIATSDRKGRYDVDLELPPKNREECPYTDAGQYRNVTFANMVKLIKDHFKAEGPAATDSAVE